MSVQEFKIYGIPFSLQSDEDPEYLKALFNFVDKKMNYLGGKFPEMSASKLSLLCSVYLLDDFIGQERESFILKEKFNKGEIDNIAKSTKLMIDALQNIL